eukprot:GHVR01154969.1.p1 GENE.GHVR01154969.1~~GHVR01154969.1.p1  ORF type:complete len:224 (+),score=127.68 GHVR01154969.1:130-801(+)
MDLNTHSHTHTYSNTDMHTHTQLDNTHTEIDNTHTLLDTNVDLPLKPHTDTHTHTHTQFDNHQNQISNYKHEHNNTLNTAIHTHTHAHTHTHTHIYLDGILNELGGPIVRSGLNVCGHSEVSSCDMVGKNKVKKIDTTKKNPYINTHTHTHTHTETGVENWGLITSRSVQSLNNIDTHTFNGDGDGIKGDGDTSDECMNVDDELQNMLMMSNGVQQDSWICRW